MTASPLSDDHPASGDTAGDPLTGITLGVTGQGPRWTISPWGAITPWGQEAATTLDWFVAADDRWHVPSDEPTVRQARIEGTPVVETRLRVPDGDAVQRAWAVPDGGGSVVVEFENESPKPFAVALSGSHVVTARPPADVPVRGIDLPADTIVVPVGHRATVRVVVPTPHASAPVTPEAIPALAPHLSVVRGWTRIAEKASRLVLPDERLVEALLAARCDLLLEGPVDVEDDATGFLLDVAELVRCGDSGEAWLLDVVAPVERLARDASRRRAAVDQVADALAGLAAARIVAAAANDERAIGDVDRTIERMVARRTDLDAAAPPHGAVTSFADLRRAGSVGRFARAIERRIADGGRLLVGGIPTGWLGANFEVHSLPTSPTSSVSFAVRWHGERPAVLWEQHGDPVALSAPDLDPAWTSTAVSGETLWSAPAAEKASRSSLSITVDPDGGSFA